MANNVVLNPGSGGDISAAEDISGVKYSLIKLTDSSVGSTTRVGTAAAPLRFDPTGTTAQPISGTLAAVTSITNSVAVTGTFWQATQPISAVSLPLPTSAATEATLATRLAAGDTLTGVTTVTNLAQLGGAAISMNTGVRALGTQRVTIATDDIVPASQSGGWNIGLLAGSANIGDVDVLTLPPLVAGTANIGDVDVLTLPPLVAGTANIGDVDIASIAAGTNRIGAIYDVGGQLQDEVPTLRTVNRAFVNASLSGNTELVASQGVGVRVRVLSMAVVATLAVTVKFQSATTDITAGFPVAANGGMVLPYNLHGWFQTSANQALNINLGLGTATGCQITWVQST